MPRPNKRQGRQDLCMGAGGYESSSSVLQYLRESSIIMMKKHGELLNSDSRPALIFTMLTALRLPVRRV